MRGEKSNGSKINLRWSVLYGDSVGFPFICFCSLRWIFFLRSSHILAYLSSNLITSWLFRKVELGPGAPCSFLLEIQPGSQRTPSTSTPASELGIALPPAKVKLILDPDTVSKNSTWIPTPWPTFIEFHEDPKAQDRRKGHYPAPVTNSHSLGGQNRIGFFSYFIRGTYFPRRLKSFYILFPPCYASDSSETNWDAQFPI